MHYLEFLRGVHDQLQPETYLEVGLRNGDSLALARCRSVGVDPAYNLTAELDGDFTILRTTSDDFFAQDDPRRVTRGRAFDLTFIDGLHLFEYSLRDFIHTERHSGRGSVIVFDDVLPRSSDEAARERHTSFWTGDVYKIAAVLAHYRPELTALIVDTEPTGLLLVMGLDPDNTTLTENYDQILAEFRTPDPQVVPDEVLRRQHALSPRRVLAGQMWSLLRDARSGPVKVELGGLLRAAAAETSSETHDDDAGPDSAPALEVAEALASSRLPERRSVDRRKRRGSAAEAAVAGRAAAARAGGPGRAPARVSSGSRSAEGSWAGCGSPGVGQRPSGRVPAGNPVRRHRSRLRHSSARRTRWPSST